MPFASYTPVGDGVFFLLGCAIGVVVMLVWVGYWLVRGFRARHPVSTVGRWALAGVVGLLVVVAVSSPPLCRAGDWRTESGEPLARPAADTLDRFLFGRIPQFAWVTELGQDVSHSRAVVSIPGVEQGFLCGCRWAVDWGTVCVEALVVGLLVLPFARARLKPEQSGRDSPK